MEQLSLFDPIQIPLAENNSAIVDPMDADLLNHKWYLMTSKDYLYAKRNARVDGKRVNIYLHRIIAARKYGRTNLLRNEQVDHINGNTLDNRRSNLRLATCSQNQFNRKKLRTNTSGLKGVYWDKKRRHWCSSISINGNNIHLGQFKTVEAAHEAYKQAAMKYAGEFARFE